MIGSRACRGERQAVATQAGAALGRVLLALAVLAAVVLAAGAWLLVERTGRETDEGEAAPGDTPAVELRSVERAQRERLRSYGWIDRQGGVGHIPIEAAMKELASRETVIDIPPTMQVSQ